VEYVPPRLARRLLVEPAVLLLAAAVLVAAPVVLLVAALVDLVLRRPWPTTRLALAAITHVVFEAFGVLCLLGLWLASGAGLLLSRPRMQEVHHRFVRWWLSGLIGITGRLLGIRVEVEDRQPPRVGAVLVFSRHAGPWDSFLLAHELVRGYRRHPRIVMKAAMQWFPVIDIVGNRLPNRFIRPKARDTSRFIGAIEELVHGLGERDALILFPEGGNFSIQRRLTAIRRLEERGDTGHAEEARRLENLVAPKPGGVMAAIRGAPHADVVFVAHTGLEPLVSIAELWRQVPLTGSLIGRYWRIPPPEVPRSKEGQVDWLFDWWKRIDAWIDDHGAGSAEMRRATTARSPDAT